MLQGIKILAADDDMMSLEMLKTILERRHGECTVAVNGREAMNALESNPDTDIVLLDLQMPIMDGFEVLSECKRNPYLSDIPVVVLAGGHQEKLKSLQMGADDFLAKPYNAEELEIRIVKLVQSRRSAQSARQAKNEFLAIASHELRTPMHEMMALCELMNGTKPGLETQELARLLKDATGNLTNVITDILNYVQLDTATASALLEPFSLRATVQGAIATLSKPAQRKGICINLHIADNVADALNGSSFYVYKVLSILLDNAVKFSSDSDVKIQLREESLGSHGSRFYCDIIDQGSGVPAAFQEKIFEPFVQVDSSCGRLQEGIGLGLAIAKRMLELMGGTINVRSNENRGSTFSFSFHCDVIETSPE